MKLQLPLTMAQFAKQKGLPIDDDMKLKHYPSYLMENKGLHHYNGKSMAQWHRDQVLRG